MYWGVACGLGLACVLGAAILTAFYKFKQSFFSGANQTTFEGSVMLAVSTAVAHGPLPSWPPCSCAGGGLVGTGPATLRDITPQGASPCPLHWPELTGRCRRTAQACLMITMVAFAMLRMLNMQAKWQSRLKSQVMGLAKSPGEGASLVGADRCAQPGRRTYVLAYMLLIKG